MNIPHFRKEFKTRFTFVKKDGTEIPKRLLTRFEPIDDASAEVTANMAKETIDKVVEELAGCNVVEIHSGVIIDPNTFNPVVTFTAIIIP